MLFGLRSSDQTFERLIYNVLRDLKFVSTYVDDILVASKTEQ